MSPIERLTPEQEELISVFQEKWKQVALSTEKIDRKKATAAIKAAYAAIGKQTDLLVKNDLSEYWAYSCFARPAPCRIC